MPAILVSGQSNKNPIVGNSTMTATIQGMRATPLPLDFVRYTTVAPASTPRPPAGIAKKKRYCIAINP